MKISKEKINQAGLSFLKAKSKVSKSEANEILQEFRINHQHPMTLFRHLIDRKLKKYKIKALVSQRLKRIPSIIKKLQIQKNMQLSRMQDIAGLRIVVSKLNDVYLLRDEIRKVEKHGNFKFNFIGEKDYIKETPKSGYRSLHLVYIYNKGIETTKQCRVEIQIRTYIHHSWATAVEVMGTYLRQPLKQSFGDKKYLDIFKDISKVFKDFESSKFDINFINKINEDINNLNLLDKLKTFTQISKYIDDDISNKGKYLLIKMDLRQNNTIIKRYSAKNFIKANNDYLILELENIDNKSVEVVLLSIDDISKLNKYYPNYFMDTTDFIKNLEKLFNYTNQMNKIDLLQKEILDDKINELSIEYFKKLFK